MRGKRLVMLCAGVFAVSACAEPERRALSAAAIACGADTTSTSLKRELVISEEEPPCDLELVPTGIVLSADRTGDRPDAGSFHARDSRGRFYSNSVTPAGFIVMWDSAGQYSGTLGRHGDGPGEFGRSVIQPWALPGDTLAFYNNRRWTIFDADGGLVGTIVSRLPMVLSPREYAVAPGGALVVGERFVGSLGRTLSLVTMAGEPIRSYGDEAPPFERGDEGGRRVVTMHGDDRFWASVLPHEGYAFEQWTLEGTLLQTLRREAPWAPRPADKPPKPLQSRYLPFKIVQIAVDEDGLLYAASLRAREGADINVRAANDSIRAEMFEVRIEVIDPVAGRVLATLGPLSGMEVQTSFPRQFPGSRLAARRVFNEDYLSDWEIVEFVLKPRGSQ